MDRGIFGRRTSRAGMLAVLLALLVALTGWTTASGREAAWAATPVVPPAPALLDLPVQPRVLLMGDSYTEGWGATPLSEGFAFHVAGPLGWRLTRDGVGSTGYLSPGLKQQGTFSQRLWRHPADGYDLVVLQGGSNDEKAPEADIAKAVDLTVRTVHRRYPSAQVLVMGPVVLNGTIGTNRVKMNRVLTGYATAHSLQLIDPWAEQWFVKGDYATMADPVKGHPNNAGYARIATLFIRDVQALSVVRPAR